MEVVRGESSGVRSSVVMLENSKIGVLLEERHNVLLEDIQNIAPGCQITFQYKRSSVAKGNPGPYHNAWSAPSIALTNATVRVSFAPHTLYALATVRSANAKS